MKLLPHGLGLRWLQGRWQGKCQPEPDNSLRSSGLNIWCPSQLTAEQKGWTYKFSHIARKDRKAAWGVGVV